MTTYNTGNSIGSADPRDLYDNAQVIDDYANSDAATTTDRLGNSRKTLGGMNDEFDADQAERAQRFSLLLANSGYEYLADYAAGIEITEYNQVLRDPAGELWRAAATTTLPYTTDGAGLPEGGAFVAVGDADIRNDLAAGVGAGKGGLLVSGAVIYVDTIADLQALDTSGLVDGQEVMVSGGLFKWNGSAFDPVGYIPLFAWGAVGDGVADDTQSLRDAIDSGYPLDWQDKTYRVIGAIGAGATITHRIDWRANGSTVKLDPTVAHQDSVLNYVIKPPHEHRIVGRFAVDASKKANMGFRLQNNDTLSYPDSYASFLSDGLEFRNIRREAGFAGGDGLRIEGAFISVTLDNLVVDDVELATGAGDPGQIGVAGATVASSFASGGYPLYASVKNPSIRNVYSEDPTYAADQDGIKLFGKFQDPAGMWSSFIVEGGLFENCWGRSIKSQMATGVVKGTHFKRSTGSTSGGFAPEIDFQGGQGKVISVSYDYNGHAPQSFVSQSAAPVNKMSGLVDGVLGRATSVSLRSVLRSYSRVGLKELIMENVHVEGGLETLMYLACPNDGVVGIVRNCRAPLTVSGVTAVVGGINRETPSICSVVMENVQNSAPGAVVAVRQRVPNVLMNATLSSKNLINFTGSTNIRGSKAEVEGPAVNTAFLGSLALYNNEDQLSKAVISGNSRTVGDLETWTIALNTADIYTLSAQANHQTTAIFAASDVSGGRVEPLVSGSSVSVTNNNTEPTSGLIRVWTTGDGLLRVKNVSGASRTIILARLGDSPGIL